MEKQKIKINPRIEIEPRTHSLFGKSPSLDNQLRALNDALDLINRHAGLDDGQYGDVYKPEIKQDTIEQFTFMCDKKKFGYDSECKCEYDESNGVSFPACCDEITSFWIKENPEQALKAFPEETHGDWVESILKEAPTP